MIASLLVILLTITLFLNCVNAIEAEANSQAKAKAIVHVGPHKTATTHLQAKLTASYSKALSTIYNYHWPSPLGNIRAKEISKFSYYLKSNLTEEVDYGEKMTKYLRKASQSNSNVILSAEDFSNLNSASIQLLKEKLSGMEVHL